MQVQSSQFFGEKPKKDVSFLKDPRISITKLYDDMAILLRKFEFSGKKYSPSKINKAKEILSRIYNFTQNGSPYVGWYVYMCERTGLSRPTVMQYFKDFKEAGLIRYELTFYKGKPVTYIHTTEVVDYFFMQIASGDKDNVIINQVMQENTEPSENQTDTQIENKDIQEKSINEQQENRISYTQIHRDKCKFFFNEKTGEYEERVEAQLINIEYFDKKFHLGSEFKVSKSEVTQQLDKIFNFKKIDVENNRYNACSYAYEFRRLSEEQRAKIVNYLSQKITSAFDEEQKKKAGYRILAELYLKFLEEKMNIANDKDRNYNGIKGLTNYNIHAVHFVEYLLKQIKFS
jgi:DNA-binding transcriptional ArsR family regulator